jgi:hypothetical protein
MSVNEMVHQVLGDTREKLAQASSRVEKEKRAAVASQPLAKSGGTQFTNDYLSKLAAACDHLASNLHLLDHARTPQEKLAEYAAINAAMLKRAFEGGDKAHQTTEANSDSISPPSVSTDDSGTGVGAGNAIPSASTNTPGTSMDAGESGEATAGNKPPQSVTPDERANPNDAPNALETNQGMMMPSQPEDLLNQPGGDEATGKIASARTLRLLNRVTGREVKVAQEKFAQAKRVKVLMAKAAQSGVPFDAAAALIQKFAGDEEASAIISAGSDPLLQSEPGVPSAQSQGAEVGSNTPRGSAPTSGEGGGRELLSSNEAAINATKGRAKQQNKGALTELLTEPMQSSAHDRTLQESLDNTSSAGVKISAARELLKKMAASSPEVRQRIAALVKQAEGYAPGAVEAAPQLGYSAPMAQEEAEDSAGDGAMDAALSAVLAGVTPEDLAAAEELLAGEAGGAEMAPEPGVAPEAGAGDQEKLHQFGMGADASAGGTSSPSPMMA